MGGVGGVLHDTFCFAGASCKENVQDGGERGTNAKFLHACLHAKFNICMKYTVIHIINIFTVLKAIYVFIMSVQISSNYANPLNLGSKHVN